MLWQRTLSLFAAGFFLFAAGLVHDASAQSNLKKCPKSTSAQWHNCFGTFKNKNGVYTGEWRNSKRNGQGTYTFANGSKYEGTFKDDYFNGQGTIAYADGGKYEGEFKDSKFNGQGTIAYADGSKYEGEWKDDKFIGQGTITYWGGGKYEGEFKDGKFNGQGTTTYADGDKYVGEWKDDKHHGRGVRYVADGAILEQGIYENGKLVKAELVDQQQVAKVEQQQVVKAEPQQQTNKSDNSSAQPVITNERKVALVIGNSAYRQAPELANPKNDATAMSDMLRRMGFEVVFGTDLGKRDLEQKVLEFVRKAKQADISLFFYAGHGIQVGGQNYLIPVDAAVKDETALDFELVNVSMVTNYIGGQDKVGIILLDACRDNPLSRSLARSLGTRSAQVGNGLAAISTQGGGVLVGFATAPGDVAVDGQGRNSPFTTALLKHLPTPGMEIQRIMTRVKAEVIAVTKNGQRPWHNSDLARDVILTQAN